MTPRRVRHLVPLLVIAAACLPASTQVDAQLPALRGPVNDFANVIDERFDTQIAATIRELEAATGDVIVVVTVRDVAPFADVRELAEELFENRGRGVGRQGQDNGILVVLAIEPRQVWIEVGYGIEPIVTDGVAGELAREVMTPFFRQGEYGAGLAAGVERLADRIADARRVERPSGPESAAPDRDPRAVRPSPRVHVSPMLVFWIVIVLLIILSNRGGRGGGRRRRRGPILWGMGPWSGWNSGVGSFGGGLGGFGGGFGGFGGGRSGGGGGGASW